MIRLDRSRPPLVCLGWIAIETPAWAGDCDRALYVVISVFAEL